MVDREPRQRSQPQTLPSAVVSGARRLAEGPRRARSVADSGRPAPGRRLRETCVAPQVRVAGAASSPRALKRRSSAPDPLFGPTGPLSSATKQGAPLGSAIDYLMQLCHHPGRPAGWWDYSSPTPRPSNHERDEAVLYEAHLLDAEEETALMARKQFERAQEPNFGVCVGPNRPWLKGAATKRAHYACSRGYLF